MLFPKRKSAEVQMNYTMVLVLYEQRLEDAKTYQSLLKHLTTSQKMHTVEVLIYDNSVKIKNQKDALPDGYKFIKNQGNIGLAKTYNDALKKAKENQSDWLVLLDQDTELTGAYFEALFNADIKDEAVVSLVPQIVSEDKFVSPISSEGLPKIEKEQLTPGIYQDLMAINSASALRVEFLVTLGGFNEAFPLDYLDHWLYFEINQRKKSIQVLDVTIQHELSVMDYNSISLGRYQSILDSEATFYMKYSLLSKKTYKKRLLLRFFKQMLTVKNKQIAKYTLKKYRELNEV